MLAGWLRAGCLAGVLPETGPLFPPSPAAGKVAPGPAPTGSRQGDIAHCPLPPPGDHRKSTPGAENPPVSLDPLRSPPFTVSCIPVRQPANPPTQAPRPAICTGNEKRVRHVHARQTLTVAPRLSCPVPVASSLPRRLPRPSERLQHRTTTTTPATRPNNAFTPGCVAPNSTERAQPRTAGRK